jgi:TAG lipase / steryl ester hydrolase / phospholipase A2 / LPA acyltransferase
MKRRAMYQFPFLSRSRKAGIAAKDYAQWSTKAQALDAASGAKAWRDRDESELYGYKSIRKRLDTLRAFRIAGDDRSLLFNLNEGIHGNMDGIGNERLYQRAAFGTKTLIEDYTGEIVSALEHLSRPDLPGISEEEQRSFFERAMHCYGRSALMLSGSGSFLYFHMGVVRAMWSEGLLPDVISGSSGGSVVGALVCTHNDEDLKTLLDVEALDKLANDLDGPKVGERLTQDQVRAQLELLIPDITFQQAYELTGRHLNISVAPAERHQNSRLLNAIASPNVLIREAVLASCAVPGVFAAVTLMARDHKGDRVPYLSDRKWVDGSMTNDLPAKRLARLYGVNHYIVSQANPAITPFIGDTKEPNSILSSIREAQVTSMKAWANATMLVWEKPLSWFPALNRMASMAMSVIEQDYGGDINFVNPPRMWGINKVLGQLSVADMQDLVSTGENEAWPRLEMIRTQTRISQTLSRILREKGWGLAA